MKRFLTVAGKTVKVIFIVFCVYIGSLFFRQERLPEAWVDAICDRLSDGDMAISAAGISYGFINGIRIDRLKVFVKSRQNPLDPVFSADIIEILPFRKKIRVLAARMPRLHDAYYEDGPAAEPLGENNGRFSLPRLPDFRLELIRPEILGVKPLRVEADVLTDPETVDFQGIKLLWPDVDQKMDLDGFCTIDLRAMRIYGQCEGLTTQAHIRPMMGDYERKVTLDIPVVLPYFDAFTEVPSPVPASCAWDVNLVNNEFTIRVRMRPELGRYNGVALREATGGVTVHVWWKDGLMQYETRVDVDSASDRFGRTFGGNLTVVGTNGVRTVKLAAASDLRKDDALNVIGYLNDGMLDCFQCISPPHVTASGVLATRTEQQYLNNLRGEMFCRNASFYGMSLANVVTDYEYTGDTMRFAGISADASRGGHLAGDVRLHFPGYDETKASYEMDVRYEHGSIEELTDVFGVDPGKRHGQTDIHLAVAGMLCTNQLSTLNGKADFTVKNGHINQMRLFMGLTDILADVVPGVASVVNQSDASGDFTITNGVARSKNIRIEGALFSISAEGEYDMVSDNLDFVVQVRLMKDDSLPGLREFVRMLSWPFSKLLMELRVSGPIKNPKWDYVSILDRVM